MIAPLVALAATVWLVVLVTAPLLPVPVAAALYALGSQICHQRPERSFHLVGAQLPVCARCAGIYAGAAVGSVIALFPQWRAQVRALPPRTLIVAGALPTVLTVALEWAGAWSASNAVRAAAGFPLGCAAALVVAQASAAVHYGQCVLRRPIASNRPPTPT